MPIYEMVENDNELRPEDGTVIWLFLLDEIAVSLHPDFVQMLESL